MINKKFWQEAAASWSWEVKPEIEAAVGSGGPIAQEFLGNPGDCLEQEEMVAFDEIDFDDSFVSMISGGQAVMQKEAGKTFANSTESMEESKAEEEEMERIHIPDSFNHHRTESNRKSTECNHEC